MKSCLMITMYHIDIICIIRLSKGPFAASRGIGGPALRAALQIYASAGAASGSSFGNGLNVMAIRKAPIPIAQEPT